MSNTNLTLANLSSAQLQGANLSGAILTNANLENANLSAADLTGANLAGANFQGVSFFLRPFLKEEQFLAARPIADSVAKIKGVDFAQVRNLTSTQIDFICAHDGIHPQCNN